MPTVVERVLDTIRAHPNRDQAQLASMMGISYSHVSVCVSLLEQHSLISHRLIRINDTGRRHRGYFTVDGAKLRRACPHCGGRLELHGFRSDALKQRCVECNRVVTLR